MLQYMWYICMYQPSFQNKKYKNIRCKKGNNNYWLLTKTDINDVGCKGSLESSKFYCDIGYGCKGGGCLHPVAVHGVCTYDLIVAKNS